MFFSSSLPWASSASIAESVNSGQRPKAMFEALQISVQAALIASGRARAAERRGTRHRVPAGLDPALIRIGPARRGGDFPVSELDAVLVANAIQRRQYVGGEFAGFLQHGGGDVAVEIAVMAGFQRGLQAGAMVKAEQHVVDRRTVGHDVLRMGD